MGVGLLAFPLDWVVGGGLLASPLDWVAGVGFLALVLYGYTGIPGYLAQAPQTTPDQQSGDTPHHQTYLWCQQGCLIECQVLADPFTEGQTSVLCFLVVGQVERDLNGGN